MEHDHSGHSGHTMPGMDMPSGGPTCSMNMLWNSQVSDVCVVFSSWHISGPATMAVSCLAIVLISILYAYLLHLTRTFDRQIAYTIYSSSNPASAIRRPSEAPPSMMLGGGGGASGGGGGGASRRESIIPPITGAYQALETGKGDRIGVTRLSIQARVIRAGMYAVCVALSFWLMLVAMTYNTFLFSSIVVGAFLGHLLYESEMDVGAMMGQSGKGLACH